MKTNNIFKNEKKSIHHIIVCFSPALNRFFNSQQPPPSAITFGSLLFWFRFQFKLCALEFHCSVQFVCHQAIGGTPT